MTSGAVVVSEYIIPSLSLGTSFEGFESFATVESRAAVLSRCVDPKQASMEPLSVAASVFAVIGAASATLKTLAKLRALPNAPDELSVLINELSDIQAVLWQVVSVVQGREAEAGGPLEALHRQVEHAQERLLALDQLVHYHLVDYNEARELQVARLAWVRANHKVKALQEELRGIRLNIGTTLQTLTLYVLRALASRAWLQQLT